MLWNGYGFKRVESILKQLIGIIMIVFHLFNNV